MCTVYSNAELRYFRLTKAVIDCSTSALRKVFKEKWNYLYPSSPWQNDGTSVSQLLDEEKVQASSSRLYDPAFSNGYHQAVRDQLSYGDVEKWDVTALVFALCHSQALSGIRSGSRWRLVNDAIQDIKEVRNTVLSHACIPSIPRRKFKRNLDIVVRAVEVLLTSSDPLVEKLKTLRTETEFVTADLERNKELLQQDHDSLLVLEKHLERLESKVNISATKSETTEDNLSNSENSKIIAKFCRRMERLEGEFSSPVDLAPARTKPAIFRSARYIRLINESSAMSYNFRWEELDRFLQSFNDDVDMQMFADIQAALSLSHQSRKDESLEMLNGLIPKALTAKHGVVLHARIKIRKAYILHDRGKDDEAMKEADEAEMMLSLGECDEDIAEVSYAKANIILSSGKNTKEDHKLILHHLNKCIHFCEKATVDKSVTVVQAKLCRALFHLGFYQHGILDSSDVNTAGPIFNCIADQSEPIAERSKVYFMYGQSLLADSKGDTNLATKLENKVRRKCEQHKMHFEIQQLDKLRTLVRGPEFKRLTQ